MIFLFVPMLQIVIIKTLFKTNLPLNVVEHHLESTKKVLLDAKCSGLEEQVTLIHHQKLILQWHFFSVFPSLTRASVL